ncbi:MAG: PHP domain-containing protein [Mogibacterium sp.]|nr:PHP domain-containing protein [Mogibacterium sp.]
MKNYREYDKESIRALIESGLKRDLHMHTYYSDGELSPRELIDLRISEGYELLSITDHDGDEGSAEGLRYAESIGLPFISGVELDSDDELGKDLHILGYGFDYDNEGFKEVLLKVRRERDNRNDRFMSALNKLGYDLTLEDIVSINEGRYVGKPTFAKALQRKGLMDNYQEAFKGIFRHETIRVIRKRAISSQEAIIAIQEAGGIAVMAHPMEQRRMDESFEDFKPRMYEILERMREYGIDGIEYKHPSASEEQQKLLAEYAKKHGLIITEGSDVHSPRYVRDYSRYHMP